MKKLAMTAASACALVASVTFAPAVFADKSYALSYNPEQITNTAGMNALHAQIREVAKEYCPEYSVGSFRAVQACVADVTEDLVEKVGAPAFTAYVEQQRTAPRPALLAGGDFD